MKLHHLPLLWAMSFGMGLAACIGPTVSDTTKSGDTGGTTDTDTQRSGTTGDTGAYLPCGNGVLDKGEECDGAELDGNTCADIDAFVDGTLTCAKGCAFETAQCVHASTWLGDARAAAFGTVSLPIAKAIVTNVRPAIGTDPAGFFVQAEMAGPALFVGVDPTTLTPVPVVGDLVSFTITELSNYFDLRLASAIDAFAVDGNVGNVSSLLQNLTASTTVITDLDDLESELVAFDATIVSDFGFSGSSNVSAMIATSGYPKGHEDLLVRLGSTLQSEIDLANGCDISFQGNIWRFMQDLQASIYDAADVTINSCPAPTVLSANASAANTVTVSFDRLLDASTVDVADFVFDNGLTSSAIAAVADRAVTITTSTQTNGLTYTVTVTGLDDTLGNTIANSANSATFTGVDFEPQLYISEIDAFTTAGDTLEFIEIWNNTASTVDLGKDGYYLVLVNGNGDLTYATIALTGSLSAGDVFLVGNTAVKGVDITIANDSIQNGADGTMLVTCPSCTGAADIANGTDPTTATTFLSTSKATVTKIDGVAHHTGDADDSDLWGVVGVTGQFDESANGLADSESLTRSATSAFTTGTPSPGTR